MATLTRPVQESAPLMADARHTDITPRWHPVTIAAFRFTFLYFGLYVLTTQMLPGMFPLPIAGIPHLGVNTPFRSLVLWVGAHVAQIDHAISFQTTGSGDKLFDWVHSLTLILIATLGTILWSAIARGTTSYPRLFGWFRLFIRFALGTTFLSYGLSKAFPLQMPIIALNRLVEPFGNFSPMGVLWYSIGASPAYEIFTGLAEIGAGVLLFLPRTAALGALMCLMDSIAVFMLNMTYDVPVKLFSFHLVLMSLYLIAPNARALFSLFIARDRAALRDEPVYGKTPGTRRAWLVAQVVFGLYVIGLGASRRWTAWNTSSSAAGPKSAFYGIWEVEQMSVDGRVLPPLLTDTTRWRRLVFQSPTSGSFWKMNDTFRGYSMSIDTTAKTFDLSSGGPTAPKSRFTYQRPTKEQMTVDGVLDGRAIHLELAYRDPDSYLVRSRGFHWISEVPFNR